MKTKSVFVIFIYISFQIVLSPTITKAKDFYIYPVNGSMSNDGSQSAPWSTLQGVLDACKVRAGAYKTPWATTVPETILNKCPTGAVTAGDTIYLMSGNQGKVTLNGFLNEDYITVKAYPGQTPTISHLWVTGSSYWRFEGIQFSPSFSPPLVVYPNGIIEIENHSNLGPNNHIMIFNSEIYSVTDSNQWKTLEDWWVNASRAIVTRSQHTIIENNRIKNTSGCVGTISAHNTIIRGNTCDMLSGDMIGVGGTNDLLIEGNTLTNMVPAGEPHGLHPDMVQFSANSELDPELRVTFRRNYVNSLKDYGIHPLVGGNAQGVSGFDGFYEDFVIENNIVAVNSPHGISLYGARNCRIVNNTVVSAASGLPYDFGTIRTYNHKSGAVSSGNLIRNNITNQIDISAGTTIVDHNLLNVVKSEHFITPENLDFRLKSTSSAINAGQPTLSPVDDYTGELRDPYPDLGAYEYKPEKTATIPPPQNFYMNR